MFYDRHIYDNRFMYVYEFTYVYKDGGVETVVGSCNADFGPILAHLV